MVPLPPSGRGRVPYGRAHRNCRDHARLGRDLSTLMRHFFSLPAPKAIEVLAGGVLPSPFAAGLIPCARAKHTRPTSYAGAEGGAVAIPAVTEAAENEKLSAGGASAVGKSKGFHVSPAGNT